jgi:vacuole morphology and inheritance protein 14
VHVINPFVRQFLLGWINVLDSVPDLDLLQYLPQVLARIDSRRMRLASSDCGC